MNRRKWLQGKDRAKKSATEATHKENKFCLRLFAAKCQNVLQGLAINKLDIPPFSVCGWLSICIYLQ